MDRLVLELKLPPSDAYYKIRNVLDNINGNFQLLPPFFPPSSLLTPSAVIEDYFQDPEVAENFRVSPELGNVVFASGEHGWSFSLTQMAQIYLDGHELHPRETVKHTEFAKRLWGDKYFDAETRKFLNAPKGSDHPRSFIEFVLEPVYKIYSQLLSEEPKDLQPVLAELGIHLSKEELALDVRPLIKVVLRRFFGRASGFVDMVVQHVPSPVAGAQRKIETTYTGPLDGTLGRSLLACDPKGPLLINVSKLLPMVSHQRFYALGRVLSGTLKAGDRVKVLGEHYTLENEEDMAIEEATALFLSETRCVLFFLLFPSISLILFTATTSRSTASLPATLCSSRASTTPSARRPPSPTCAPPRISSSSARSGVSPPFHSLSSVLIPLQVQHQVGDEGGDRALQPC